MAFKEGRRRENCLRGGELPTSQAAPPPCASVYPRLAGNRFRKRISEKSFLFLHLGPNQLAGRHDVLLCLPWE